MLEKGKILNNETYHFSFEFHSTQNYMYNVYRRFIPK